MYYENRTRSTQNHISESTKIYSSKGVEFEGIGSV